MARAIAAVKGLLVAAVFMELRERPLIVAFAAAGFFFRLSILLWLGGADFLTRPGFP